MFQSHLSLLALTFCYAMALQSVEKNGGHLHHLHHDTLVSQAENLTHRQIDSAPASDRTHAAKEISTNNRTGRTALSEDLSRSIKRLEEILNLTRAKVSDTQKRSTSTKVGENRRGPGCCN